MTPDDMASTHAAAFTASRPWSAQEFTDLLAARGVFCIGDARCFGIVRVIADEAELLTLATHPEHQRQGHARALMDRWMAQARQKGATTAFLDVAADNAAAIALYERSGFAETGRRKGYYARTDAPTVDAVLMQRSLDQS